MSRFLVLALLPLASAMAEPQDPVLVAVASNFTTTCEKIAEAFEKAHGGEVQISSGSTGKLFAQVVNGGPYHVFLSADSIHVDRLLEAELAVANTRRVYAIGRLALYSASRSISGGGEWLRHTEIGHLAISNPEVAPYGKAAVECLEKMGLWKSFQNRIVIGENIAQTFQFVQSGAADAGFVAYSQVIGTPEAHYWLVPEDQHTVLRQDAVLLRAGSDIAAARTFLAFLNSEKSRAILAERGYGLPTGQHADIQASTRK